MTGHIVPLDPVPVLVVEHRQTGLVMELLQPLYRDTDAVVCIDRTFLDSFVVVWLWNVSFACSAPIGVRAGLISWRDPSITSSSPEPSIDIDRLEVGTITPLVLEVTLPPTGVDGSHIVSGHDLLKHLELPWRVEGYEVHTAVPAEVPSIEPVPVLKLMPGFPPGQEVVMVANLHVSLPFHTLLNIWSVE